MKIKTEPCDGNGSSSGGQCEASPKKKSQTVVVKTETTTCVKKEGSDSPVKPETSSHKKSPVVKREPIDSLSDITTHVVKSEVKLEARDDVRIAPSSKRATKKKKTVRKKASVRKTKKKTTKKKVSRKKGTRKGKKGKVLRSSRVLSSVHSRLAAKIGITKKKTLGPHSLPLINKPHFELPPVRSNVVPAISILGYELTAPLGDDFDENLGPTGLALASRPSFTASRLMDLKAGMIADPLEDIRSLNSDVLGSILQTQEVLLAPSHSVIVSSDGTLKLNSSASVRRHTSTNDASEGKAYATPPPPESDPESGGNVRQSNNNTEHDSSVNQTVVASMTNGKQERDNVSFVRAYGPTCGMPPKKRKFEAQDLTAPAIPVEVKPTVSESEADSGKAAPLTALVKVEETESAGDHEAKESVLSGSLVSDKPVLTSAVTSVTPANDVKSEDLIPAKLESAERQAEGDSPASPTPHEDVQDRKVKRCRHGKIKDKTSKEPKSHADSHSTHRKEDHSEKRRDSKELTSKSNGAEDSKRRIVVRSEVRDKKAPEKDSRSEDQAHHSHRSQTKKCPETKKEAPDHRQHHKRDEDRSERERSRSSRRVKSREPQSPRRGSRYDDERSIPHRSDDPKSRLQTQSSDYSSKEQDRSRRHHHRTSHSSERRGRSSDRTFHESNPPIDPKGASSSRVQAYDKPQNDSQRYLDRESSRSRKRRTSGPRTPPDFRKSVVRSNDSPPTPTLDEAISPSVPGSTNGTTQQERRRPVPSRAALNDIKDYLRSDPPLFASPVRVNNSNWLKQFTRSDASNTKSSSGSGSIPSQKSSSSKAEEEKELDSGTNPSAIQQFLQNMLSKTKSAAETRADAAYSPDGSPIESPPQDDPPAKPGQSDAYQSIVDQILRSAQLAQQTTSSTAQSKGSTDQTQKTISQEDRQKARASVRKLVSGDAPSSTDDLQKKEKVSPALVRGLSDFVSLSSTWIS